MCRCLRFPLRDAVGIFSVDRRAGLFPCDNGFAWRASRLAWVWRFCWGVLFLGFRDADQFRFWQRGDDIAVVAIAPAGGCAFADMKFVGVQLWIGRVDGENVDMHMAFVRMQDNRPVDAVWHTGREIPDDTCGPMGNLIFVVRISPHFPPRHRMRMDLGIEGGCIGTQSARIGLSVRACHGFADPGEKGGAFSRRSAGGDRASIHQLYCFLRVLDML